MRHRGNIEPYLSYPKLHRTGRLLKGIKVKRSKGSGGSTDIILYNNTPYASEHENGGASGHKTIRSPYVTGGASGVLTGGNIVARPHMRPSKEVLDVPRRLINEKMHSFGW